MRSVRHSTLITVFFASACGSEGPGNGSGTGDAGSHGDGRCAAEDFRAVSGVNDRGWLMSTWGDGQAAFAVGGVITRQSEAGSGVMYRRDGSTWSEVALPEGTPLLNWVFGFGPDDVWVVGEFGTILRWNGSEWTEFPSLTEQTLWGIWGSGPDDLWAVGGGGQTVSSFEPTILRFDGTSWRQQAVPALDPVSAFQLFKVWGRSADDVYVVGMQGVVLHWDGTELRQIPVPSEGQDWVALWGNERELVLVGGRGDLQISYLADGEWTEIDDRFGPGLNGVWTGEPGTAYAVGERSTLLELDLTSGTIAAQTRMTEDLQDVLHAVHGAGGSVVTVGGNLATLQAPFTGLLFECF